MDGFDVICLILLACVLANIWGWRRSRPDHRQAFTDLFSMRDEPEVRAPSASLQDAQERRAA